MELRKEFTFAAAHRLPNVPEGHQCGRVHGHNYRVAIVLRGQLHRTYGWVVDFGDIKQEWNRLCDIWLDHRYLNDMPGLHNPTAEVLCWFLFDALVPTFEGLQRIEVWETDTSMAALERAEYMDAEARALTQADTAVGV